jgi:hypothetical protein
MLCSVNHYQQARQCSSEKEVTVQQQAHCVLHGHCSDSTAPTSPLLLPPSLLLLVSAAAAAAVFLCVLLQAIEAATGQRTCIVYGALPAETRRQQVGRLWTLLESMHWTKIAIPQYQMLSAQ